ncbi:MAG TPA: nitroreductase/quinone reductase family protein [Candidatus Bathyarchaeia archaeon]|nr:nitroreductase/quinone reductase family protein [Candidatus Bathyarchaeia archaeon]
MKSEAILAKLKKEKEIELTVRGRKSGKSLPRPVWFVLRGSDVLLLPVTGTDSQWYKNIVRNPQVKIRADRQTFEGKLSVLTEKRQVNEVIELFNTKYGASDIKKYYPNPNVATALRLG